MSACGSSFFRFLRALLLYIILLFSSYICSRRFRLVYASTMRKKNRKSWPALQHRFYLYLFVAVFSRSTGLRSILSQLFHLRRFRFGPNGLPAILTKWRNRPFIVILSADHLFAKRNFKLIVRGTNEIPPWSCTSRRLIREIQKFQLFTFNLKIISQEIYANSKYHYLYKFHIIIIFNIYT